eukprot:TRINITY_DN50199_c0_g1_i1.p1 TRINITY_DN50199_c0_g1~~TRINITY_DN50199_c0_g1_i1.p1  ORF type:complete len:463 (+),score=73.88 TRINITY_DN50199_c0_g1_i1:126-1391(+)
MAVVADSATQAEEFRRLQAQVDQMKERLDFIGPMIPTVNVARTYVQRLECEAVAQMMRLKGARVPSVAPVQGQQVSSDGQNGASRWLNFLTDAVIELHCRQEALRHAPVPVEKAAGKDASIAPSPGQERTMTQAGTSSSTILQAQSSGTVQPSPAGGGSRFLRTKSPGPAADHLQARSPGPATDHVRARSPGAAAEHMRARSPAPVVNNIGFGMGNSSRSQIQFEPNHQGISRGGGSAPSRTREISPGVTAVFGRGMPVGEGTPNLKPALVAQPQSDRWAVDSVFPGAVRVGHASDPNAERSRVRSTSRPRVAERPREAEEEHDLGADIRLGKGSWANAYRQARGTRREALRLLCITGIVTPRELGDDNTVIDKEHVDECTLIACDMLQARGEEAWKSQPEEAKTFFENRLTALFARKQLI